MNASFSSSRLGRANSYGGSRAQNYMPDGYWQVQLSFSKEITGDPLQKYYDPLILANVNKVNHFLERKRVASFLTKLGSGAPGSELPSMMGAI